MSLLYLLRRALQGVLFAAALVIPVYFFVSARAPQAPAQISAPMLPAPKLLPAWLAGPFQADGWIDQGKHRLRKIEFRPEGLSLRALARQWRAAYYRPAQTVRWNDYRVQVGIAGLGRPDSGANATLIVGATAPRYAVTLSADRLTLGLLADRTHQRLLSRKLERPAARHSLTATVAGKRLRVRVDDRLLIDVRVQMIRGGIGLGVWRAQALSPQPLFTKLSLRPTPPRFLTSHPR